MAYTKTTWTNNSGQPIDADNLNNIENGIETVDTTLTSHTLASNPHSITKATLGLGNVPDGDYSNSDSITEGTVNLFVTAVQEANFETAYTHSQQPHAQADADKTSDVLQGLFSGGTMTELYLDGVIATDKVMTNGEVVGITDALDTRVTTNENNIITHTGDISTNTDDIVALTAEVDSITDGSAEYEKIAFPTTTTPTLTEGQIGYDGLHKQFIMKDDISASTLNVGHEMWLKCYNPGGTTILNGTPVRQIGVSSGYASVEPAIADSFSNAIIIGLATHDIPAGEYGNLATIGQVSDVPVNQGGETWSVGEALYLSSTVVGELTNVLPPVGTVVGTLLTTNSTVGNLYAKTASLISLPPVGGWMKLIPTTIDPGAGYNQFSGFTDVSTSAGIVGDGATGIFDIDNSGTYEISLSVSFSGINAETNGSIITIQLYNVNGGVSLFEYNVIVGRNDTVASGTLITQGDFTADGQLVARYKESSGNVGATVSVDNISFIIKSVLIR